MIPHHIDWGWRSLKLMMPDFESFENCKQFFVVDIEVEFGWCKGLRVKSDQMDLICQSEIWWKGWLQGHSLRHPFQQLAESPESSELRLAQWWRLSSATWRQSGTYWRNLKQFLSMWGRWAEQWFQSNLEWNACRFYYQEVQLLILVQAPKFPWLWELWHMDL